MMRVAFFVSAAVIGCGAPIRHPPVAPSPIPAEPEPAVTTLPPASPPLVREVGAEGDEVFVVMGAVRAAVRGTDVAIAETSPMSPIVCATETPSGWLFLSQEGVAASSQSFLGPLHRLGEMPHGFHEGQQSRGRIAVADERHELWSTDGTAPLARIATPGDVVSVAFDGARGLIVVDGGALYSTEDGGGTWTPVDVEGGTAFSVDVWDPGFRIRIVADGGAFYSTVDGGATVAPVDVQGYQLSVHASDQGVIAEGGRALRDTLPDQPSEQGVRVRLPDGWRALDDGQPYTPRLDPREAETLLARALSRQGVFPAYLGSDWAPRVVRLADGRAYWWDGHLETLTATGEMTVADLGPGGPSRLRSPHLYAWGDALALVTARRNLVYRVTDGASDAVGAIGAWFAYTSGGSFSAVAFSDDGHHAAWLGECEGGGLDLPSSRVCVVDARDSGVVDLPEQDQVETFYGMHGGALLLRTANRRLAVLERGRLTERNPRALSGDAVPERARVAPDGTISALYTVDGVLELWAGTDELRRIELPDGALDAELVDHRHGLSLGEDLAHVFQTHDAGAHWERVEPPVDGDPATMTASPSLVCAGQDCVVDHLLRVSFRELPSHGRFMTRMNSVATTAPEYAPRPLRIVCEPAAAPRPRAAASGVTRLAAAGLQADLQLSTHGSEVRARWRGHDAHGEFAVTSREAPLPARPVNSTEFVLRGGTRAGILVERCSAELGGQCFPLWISRRGVAEVPVGTGLQGLTTTRVTSSSIPLPGGGVLMLITGSGAAVQSPTTDVSTVWRLGPGPRCRAERSFTWSRYMATREEHDALGRTSRVHYMPSRPTGLATWRGVPGLVALDASAENFTFHPLEGDGPAATIPLGRGPVRVCGGAAGPDDAEVTLRAVNWSTSIDLGDGVQRRDLQLRLRVGSDGTCIEAVSSWALNDPSSLSVEGLALRARDGVLEGTYAQGSEEHTLRCTTSPSAQP